MADPERPGITNLLSIYAAATVRHDRASRGAFRGTRAEYGDVKKELVEVLVETLRPLRRTLTSEPRRLIRPV